MSTKITGTARIIGTRITSSPQGSRVRAYQNGRVCSHGACDTILSVYNPSRFCSVHAGLAAAGRKRGRQRPVREVACGNCGEVFETANTARKFCSDRCRMAAFARRKRAAVRAESRLQQEQALQAVASSENERDALLSAA